MESKRQLQVSELIKRHFSVVLQESGRNIYGSLLVSVTQVIVTPDLSLAKIYVSVYGTENKQEVVLMMEENAHHLKQSLVRRIKRHIRRIPDIDYYLDDTLDEMYKVDKLFDDLT
jgi:ribosome-binding factor A